MFARRAIATCLFLYFLFSGITWVSGEAGKGIAGRLIIADFLGLIVIAIACVQVIYRRKMTVFMPVQYAWYMPVLLCMSASSIFSQFPLKGFLETLVHLYIFIVSLCLYNILMRWNDSALIEKMLLYVLYSGGLLACTGLLQFFLLPSIFEGSHGGLSGTFRNTGQAGSFFGTFLALLIPAFLTGIVRPSIVNLFFLSLILVALAFTFKRAALIGFLIGVSGLIVRLLLSSSIRDKKIGIYSLIIALFMLFCGSIMFLWGLDNIEGMAWRFNNKVNADAFESFADGFFAENLNVTISAFIDRPLIGVGPGNVAGIYSEKYEIHSTYMKIIATIGIVGTIAYSLYMLVIVLRLIRSKYSNVYGRYLTYFFPFYIGLIVSWGYTYHLRKREFWVMLALVSFLMYLAKSSAAINREKASG